MSQPQTQPKPSMISGLNHRRGDRDLGNRSESVRNEYHKYRPSRSGLNNDTSTERFVHPVHQQNDDNSHVNNSSQSVTTTAKISEDKTEVFSQGESRNGDSDTLLCLTACLIGQLVEVQVKNGSVYSGIFHTANAEKDYGLSKCYFFHLNIGCHLMLEKYLSCHQCPHLIMFFVICVYTCQKECCASNACVALVQCALYDLRWLSLYRYKNGHLYGLR